MEERYKVSDTVKCKNVTKLTGALGVQSGKSVCSYPGRLRLLGAMETKEFNKSLNNG